MTPTASELANLSRLPDEALDLAPERLEAWLTGLPPAEQRLVPQLIRLDHGGVQSAAAVMPTEAAFKGIGRQGFMGLVALTKGELLCRSGKPVDGLQMVLDLEHFNHDENGTPDFDPFLIRTRAFIGLCALSLGKRVLALQKAKEARAGLAAQPKTARYFFEPLFEARTGSEQQGRVGRCFKETGVSRTSSSSPRICSRASWRCPVRGSIFV